MRWWILVALGAVACDASFSRNGEPSSASPFADPVDLGVVEDEVEDGGLPSDLGALQDLGPTDLGLSDAGIADQGGEPEEAVLSEGSWRNRGYSVTGSAELRQRPDGSVFLRMSDDFQGADFLPGPTLFFSDRAEIGRSGIQPGQGDIRIGRFDELSGPFDVEVPPEAAERRFVWIYCEPFSAQMHSAELVAP